MRSEQIADLVNTAFADTEPPSIVIEHECDECQEVQLHFGGKRWRSISYNPQDLLYFADDVFLFNPEAFHYYVPLWLLASIRYPGSSDIIPEALVSMFTYPEQSRDLNRFTSRMKLFSVDQLQAVEAVLTYLRDLDAANCSATGAYVNQDEKAIETVQKLRKVKDREKTSGS